MDMARDARDTRGVGGAIGVGMCRDGGADKGLAWRVKEVGIQLIVSNAESYFKCSTMIALKDALKKKLVRITKPLIH